MGAFEFFPYTNFHDANLGWVIDQVRKALAMTETTSKDMAELTAYVKDYFNSTDFESQISNKIDTMASDGTLAGLIAEALYSPVTPQMFGAKADGLTDDSAAIQSAINTHKQVRFPAGQYLIYTPIRLDIQRDSIDMDADAMIVTGTAMPSGAIQWYYPEVAPEIQTGGRFTTINIDMGGIANSRGMVTEYPANGLYGNTLVIRRVGSSSTGLDIQYNAPTGSAGSGQVYISHTRISGISSAGGIGVHTYAWDCQFNDITVTRLAKGFVNDGGAISIDFLHVWAWWPVSDNTPMLTGGYLNTCAVESRNSMEIGELYADQPYCALAIRGGGVYNIKTLRCVGLFESNYNVTDFGTLTGTDRQHIIMNADSDSPAYATVNIGQFQINSRGRTFAAPYYTANDTYFGQDGIVNMRSAQLLSDWMPAPDYTNRPSDILEPTTGQLLGTAYYPTARIHAPVTGTQIPANGLILCGFFQLSTRSTGSVTFVVNTRTQIRLNINATIATCTATRLYSASTAGGQYTLCYATPTSGAWYPVFLRLNRTSALDDNYIHVINKAGIIFQPVNPRGGSEWTTVSASGLTLTDFSAST